MNDGDHDDAERDYLEEDEFDEQDEAEEDRALQETANPDAPATACRVGYELSPVDAGDLIKYRQENCTRRKNQRRPFFCIYDRELNGMAPCPTAPDEYYGSTITATTTRGRNWWSVPRAETTYVTWSSIRGVTVSNTAKSGFATRNIIDSPAWWIMKVNPWTEVYHERGLGNQGYTGQTLCAGGWAFGDTFYFIVPLFSMSQKRSNADNIEYYHSGTTIEKNEQISAYMNTHHRNSTEQHIYGHDMLWGTKTAGAKKYARSSMLRTRKGAREYCRDNVEGGRLPTVTEFYEIQRVIFNGPVCTLSTCAYWVGDSQEQVDADAAKVAMISGTGVILVVALCAGVMLLTVLVMRAWLSYKRAKGQEDAEEPSSFSSATDFEQDRQRANAPPGTKFHPGAEHQQRGHLASRGTHAEGDAGNTTEEEARV
ncbi:unnamed protein product [Amoebophrya sp. A25]|nr:unnamed protein product [Amoebophrya sp. A25]|eukprot:GSA25T00023403001.1